MKLDQMHIYRKNQETWASVSRMSDVDHGQYILHSLRACNKVDSLLLLFVE
jgi:hypothetical protein